METNAIISALNLSSTVEAKPSKLKITAKILLVAIVVAGLAAAIFFSSGFALAMIATHAAMWKIGIAVTLVMLSSISFLGSWYFSHTHKMFEDTRNNLADAGRFGRDVLLTGYHFVAYVIKTAHQKLLE